VPLHQISLILGQFGRLKGTDILTHILFIFRLDLISLLILKNRVAGSGIWELTYLSNLWRNILLKAISWGDFYPELADWKGVKMI